MMQGLDDSFDAVLFVCLPRVGGGARPGCRTPTTRARSMEARLGGAVTGEAGINALVAAHYGVPVVLVTGDRLRLRGDGGADPGRARRGGQGARPPAGRAQPAPGARARADPGDGATKAIAGAACAEPPPVGSATAGDLRPHRRHRGGGGLGPGRGAHGARGNCASSGEEPALAVYRCFCAAILLTRSVAEVV